jgi:hypothetical protein
MREYSVFLVTSSNIPSQYDDASSKTAAYLVWPDARLRAYLRNRGVSEAALPTTRPGLLQETRIRWVQTQTKLEAAIIQAQYSLHSALHVAETKIADLLSLITGAKHEAAQAAWEGRAQWEDAKGTARSKVATASGEARGEGEWAKGKASSLSAEAGKATEKVKKEL